MKFLLIVLVFFSLSAEAQKGFGRKVESAISISRIPSIQSGPAPLAVFFDTVGTRSPAITSKPFHEIEYTWNFGDPAGGATWSYGSLPNTNNKNITKGPMVAHIYETAGSYSACVVAYDGTNTSPSTCVTITVTDPNTVFSGTNTICVDDDSEPVPGVGGCPAGAAVLQSNSWPTIINTHATAGKRILLNRGGIYTGTATANHSSVGPNIIAAYGTGAKPAIKTTGTSNNSIMLNITGAASDISYVDLSFDGDEDPNRMAVRVNGSAVNRILFLRVDMIDMGGGYQGTPSQQTGLPNEIYFVDSTIQNINNADDSANASGQGMGIGTSKLAILGSYISQTTSQHPLRMYYINKGVISNSTIRQGPACCETITLRSASWDTSTISYLKLPVSQYVAISDNQFETTGNVGLHIAPTNTTSVEHLENIVAERNWYWQPAGTSSSAGISVQATNVTIRNEIIDLTNSPSARQIISIAGPTGVSPTSSGVAVYNVSGYSADVSGGNFTGTIIASGASGTNVKNTLMHAPNVTTNTVVNNSGTDTTGASGTFGNSSNAQSKNTNPEWTITSPMTVSSFDLGVGSYADEGGVSVPVFSDFYQNSRTGTYSSGAVNP